MRGTYRHYYGQIVWGEDNADSNKWVIIILDGIKYHDINIYSINGQNPDSIQHDTVKSC
jgi:hypothetical protein